jgi:two-component system sensor histidine kinase DesK
VTLATVALVCITAVITSPMPAVGLFDAVTAQVWNLAYSGVIDVLAIGGLYGAARLVAQVGDLERTRAALARSAVDAERRRLSGDLHDVLGQSLTALSLKADLARRLVHRDRPRAAAELDGLLRLATAQEAEVDAITRGARTVELAAEVRAAVALLEAAGARVSATCASTTSTGRRARCWPGWSARARRTSCATPGRSGARCARASTRTERRSCSS